MEWEGNYRTILLENMLKQVDQFMLDMESVFIRRSKKIDDFPPEYQKRLLNCYRFSGTKSPAEAAPSEMKHARR